MLLPWLKGQENTENIINLDLKCACLVTSNKGVVKDHQADEDVIEYRKSNQKSIEGILHLLAGQDEDGDGVAKQSKQANQQLDY